jgi:hypothetical protein
MAAPAIERCSRSCVSSRRIPLNTWRGRAHLLDLASPHASSAKLVVDINGGYLSHEDTQKGVDKSDEHDGGAPRVNVGEVRAAVCEGPSAPERSASRSRRPSAAQQAQ